MYSIYADGTDMDIISDQNGELLGFGVELDTAKYFDKLTLEMFKTVVLYLLAHYQTTRNNKNLSVNHMPFSNVINGNPWLLYLQISLDAVGDTALQDCDFSELPEEVKLTSDTPPKGKRAKRGTSPNTHQQNKDNYLESKKAAYDIFSRKNKMAIKFGTQHRFNELTDEVFNPEEELFGVKKYIRLEKKKKAAAAAGDEDSSDNDKPDKLTQFVRRKKQLKGKLRMANSK